MHTMYQFKFRITVNCQNKQQQQKKTVQDLEASTLKRRLKCLNNLTLKQNRTYETYVRSFRSVVVITFA